MHRWLIICSAALALGVQDEAQGCGSVGQSFFGMILETRKEVLEEFLKEYSCGSPEYYSPSNADPYIVLVLSNSVTAGVPRTSVEAVLDQFNCVARIRDLPIYKRIVDYVGHDRFSEICAEDRLRGLYIVSSRGGANLRTKPSEDAEKLAAIAGGAIVTNARPHGEWVLVDTYRGTGFMHQSTLEPYLDDS